MRSLLALLILLALTSCAAHQKEVGHVLMFLGAPLAAGGGAGAVLSDTRTPAGEDAGGAAAVGIAGAALFVVGAGLAGSSERP